MQTPGRSSDDHPPPRPDALSSTLRAERRWLPAAVVLCVMFVVVFGGYVTAAALSEPAGAPVRVAGIVSVRPLSGWEFAGRDRIAGAPFARITRGNGNLDVVAVVPNDESPERLARDYIDNVLSRELSQLSVSDRFEAVTLASGAPALRFGYVGVLADTGGSIEGEVTVVVRSNHGVVFDGWAPEGLLPFVRADVETMVQRAEVR